MVTFFKHEVESYGMRSFNESVARVNSKLIEMPFGPKVEKCLAKLPTKLCRQIRAVQRQTARGPGLPHPEGWEETTR